jgi:hypothetical protein
MGYWFLLAWLEAGVPVSTMMYVPEHQRCLDIADEHLEAQQRPGSYVEVVYIGCPQGSPPRSLGWTMKN